MPTRQPPEQIPEHLKPFIAHQDASLYTPIDHAAWRFILRISMEFFAKHAHPKYLRGLEETGISVDRIPLIEEMDQKLRRFGWRAVPVSGFIPPAAFMEFQSLGILPIACEMRTLEHLAYTPAPDIVHEAAGHAPIISDPEYSQYLREYGEIARKAIFSSEDLALFSVIRELSDLKENPRASSEQISALETRLEADVSRLTYLSEATLLARMNWWTVEYGLVGSADGPRIYGAGLLSSVGESFACLKPEVQKINFTVDCVKMSYDITRPQPQLFVTPDFAALTDVLHEFADTMAFRVGGRAALEKAKQSAAVTTTMLDSNVQISGVLAEFREDPAGETAFLKFSGACQLSVDDDELPDQGPKFHAEGFSTPVGLLRGRGGKTAAFLSITELGKLGFIGGAHGRLSWASGIELEGCLLGVVPHPTEIGRNAVLRFKDCTIRWGSEVLYRPEWGAFDLACGGKVTSVFGGAADRAHYLVAQSPSGEQAQIPKSNLTPENRRLNELYAEVRAVRDGSTGDTLLAPRLVTVAGELETLHPGDWLLRLELLELNEKLKLSAPWAPGLRQSVEELRKVSATQDSLIHRGLEILSK